MRQTTLKTLLHHRRAKVDTGLFSTPTMQRVSRSKSRREGRARSYSGVCTLHSDTRKHRGRTHRVSTGGCVRRSRSGKHRSTSRAGSQSRRVKILGNPGEFLIPGSQSPSSALVPAAHTVMGSPEAAGSCRSGICPAGAARQGCPRVTHASRAPRAVAVAELLPCSRESRQKGGATRVVQPGTGVTC